MNRDPKTCENAHKLLVIFCIKTIHVVPFGYFRLLCCVLWVFRINWKRYDGQIQIMSISLEV